MSFDNQITFIYTKDLDRAAAFYETVLSLFVVQIQEGGCRIYKTGSGSFLGVCRERTGRVSNPEGTIVCFVTTTSARVEWFSRPLMQTYGVRMIVGKGGLGEESRQVFQELGGVYLAIMGGTPALETTWIDCIEDIDLDDLNPESLWQFRITAFGPLLVAMDAHGGSLYDQTRSSVSGNLAKVKAGF